MDATEGIGREMVEKTSYNAIYRKLLEAERGQVWDTKELQKDFTVMTFLAPFVLVTRKSDGVKGTLTFQPDYNPRLYYSFCADNCG